MRKSFSKAKKDPDSTIVGYYRKTHQKESRKPFIYKGFRLS